MLGHPGKEAADTVVIRNLAKSVVIGDRLRDYRDKMIILSIILQLDLKETEN